MAKDINGTEIKVGDLVKLVEHVKMFWNANPELMKEPDWRFCEDAIDRLPVKVKEVGEEWIQVKHHKTQFGSDKYTAKNFMVVDKKGNPVKTFTPRNIWR